MRSVDRRRGPPRLASLRALGVASLALALSGCATVTDLAQTARDKVAGLVTPSPTAAAAAPASTTAPAPAARAAAPATAASAVAAKPPPPAEPPVPAEARRSFDQALRALRAGRRDEAQRGLEALAKAYPDLGGPNANLGLLHRDAGRLPEAMAALEAAVKASPRQPLYWNELGVTYRMAGQFPKAREAYERAIDLDDRYPAALLNQGILLDLYLPQPERALQLYERYLALTPGGDANVTKWIADLKNRLAKAGKVARQDTPNAKDGKEK